MDTATRTKRINLVLLCVYILSLPLSMLSIGSFGSLLRVISIIIGVLSFSAHLYYRDNIINNSNVVKFWIIYTVYVLISCFWSNNISLSFTVAFGLIQVFLISYILTTSSFSKEDIRVIEYSWVIVAIVCIYLLLFNEVNTEFIDGRRTLIFKNGHADPNELTAYFIVPTAIMLQKIFTIQKKYIFLPVILLVFIFYSIVITGSRSGILAFLIVFFVTFFKEKYKLRNILLVIALILLAYVMVFIVFRESIPPQIIDRLNPRSIIDDGGSLRTTIWIEAFIGMIRSNFRVFYGFGPFGASNLTITQTMHNHFLQSYIDGGIIGLLLFSSFIYTLFKKRSEISYYYPVLFGGLIMVLTLTSYASFKPIWAIFLYGLIEVAKSNNSKSIQGYIGNTSTD